MVPDVVVDVGNTRIKWGAVASPSGLRRIAALPDDPASWSAQLQDWSESAVLPSGPRVWVIASVQPARTARLKGWIESIGDRVIHLDRAAKLPLEVALPEPDKAGIDRLLNAVAAKRKLPPGQAAVLVDAGSAVTIDYLDERHVFRGGLIAPGLDLMAKALNGYTALLPVVEVTLPVPTLPATATIPAMQAGIFSCVSGCIERAVRDYSALTMRKPRVYFTGGQSPLLVRAMGVGQAFQPDSSACHSPTRERGSSVASLAGASGCDRPLAGASGCDIPLAGASGCDRPLAGASGCDMPLAGASGCDRQKSQAGTPDLPDWELWPEQTLMGILFAVEGEP